MNGVISNKKILFIAPVFYEYHNKIKQQLEQWGNTVHFFPEREYGLRYSLVNNFFNTRMGAEQERYYTGILNATAALSFDHIFIIRGFLMPAAFVEALRQRHPQAVFIMHQWDSLNNYDYRKYLPLFDKFFSFDPVDCDHNPALRYLPNFYLPEYVTPKETDTAEVYDLSFIGSVYDDRLFIIEEIMSQLQGRSFYHHCYLNRLGYFKKYILKGRSSKLIKTNPLPLSEVFRILRQSRVVLDIHSEGQTGFTYRAIDAIAAGKKLITTDHYIQREPFYNENNILIIDRKKPRIRPDLWETPFTPVNVTDYSVASWLTKIFS